MAGTVPEPIGITDPPIDDLLTHSESKYGLVLYASKRARQINAYYAQLNEGLLENVGPLVDTRVQEKPLSIAMREINEGLLTAEPAEPAPEQPATPPLAQGVEVVESEHAAGDEIV
ncbi:DNA-directed RNA polymerase subunit omega [Isoptericola halotolerans]|uniref:DNA-directed RNA polymerase subunit omega n=1 Tax=Isoptericola halotolerans TaxID=300560 RepID=UPI00388E82C4